MKLFTSRLTAFRALAVASTICFCFGAALAQTPQPKVIILATGGTIAGSSGTTTDTKYEAGVLDVDSLIAAVPAMKDIAIVEGERISNVGSQDMSATIWYNLAARISEAYDDPSISGVVITHGTDTIEETAFFLDLVFPSGKPIVLTGSMRPADSISADGPKNLEDAVRVAATSASAGRGVLVVLNQEIHSARGIIKAHTENVDAFVSEHGGMAGEIINGKPHYLEASARAIVAPNIDNWLQISDRTLPKIGIIYGHVDSDPILVRFFGRNSYDGIVLAGVGNGNTNKRTIQELSKVVDRMVVVRSSRVRGGFVSRNVELDDDDLGFVAAEDLSPQKARILLQLLLAKETPKSEIQALFRCNTPLNLEYCN
ncbi:asparaginase [Hyphococcus sp.]|uniref:asparaginase n=1 Tax=Hyphococcus sp. TaxID=2038636 RepID=UPI0035C74B52